MANLDHSTRLLALIAAAALAALLLLVVAAAKPAGAAFPGENGKMAFVRGVDNNSEIYVMDGDGSGQTRLTTNTAFDTFPAFSPDDEKIVFSSNREDNFEIYVMNSDGSGTPTRLTNDPLSESKPDWGPLPDTTPPHITLTTPADGATYTVGQLVNAEYSCQDEVGGSGLVSCMGPVRNGDPIDTATVGPRTFTVEAADYAGNMASSSHVYSVVYDFDGFFSPVNELPTFNTIKAGRAIPVKFSLGGDQGLDIFAEGYPRAGTIPADPNAPLDNIEQTETAGESRLSYDPTTGWYTYVWKTSKAWSGQSRQLVLKLDDRSEHKANFELN